MLYAITDIETTGSYASANSIIEIGICLHDGDRIIREFHSLLDPGISLPAFITHLTGITDEMLSSAPTFAQIADEVEAILEGAIFVAHNVAFDYSFIRAEFAAIGRNWSSKRLCTVRLARKAFPGHSSYSLTNLCATMNIRNEAAHRALGDARAAAQVFEQSMQHLDPNVIQQMIARIQGEIHLPPNLNKSEYEQVPETIGIYYLQDQHGVPIYIGKARNLKKRIKQHFASGTTQKRNQDFMRQIHHISFEETGTELIALLLEDREIRKHRPQHNRAQKKSPTHVHLVSYEDQVGYQRLAIQPGNKYIGALKTFHNQHAARNWIASLAAQFHLDVRLLGLDLLDLNAPTYDVSTHNDQLAEALDWAQRQEPNFVIRGKGRNSDECSYLMIKQGKLFGYCFLPNHINHISTIEDAIIPLPTTEVNASIIAGLCAMEYHKDKIHFKPEEE